MNDLFKYQINSKNAYVYLYEDKKTHSRITGAYFSIILFETGYLFIQNMQIKLNKNGQIDDFTTDTLIRYTLQKYNTNIREYISKDLEREEYVRS